MAVFEENNVRNPIVNLECTVHRMWRYMCWVILHFRFERSKTDHTLFAFSNHACAHTHAGLVWQATPFMGTEVACFKQLCSAAAVVIIIIVVIYIIL